MVDLEGRVEPSDSTQKYPKESYFDESFFRNIPQKKSYSMICTTTVSTDLDFALFHSLTHALAVPEEEDDTEECRLPELEQPNLRQLRRHCGVDAISLTTRMYADEKLIPRRG